jgi:hypothetical protein
MVSIEHDHDELQHVEEDGSFKLKILPRISVQRIDLSIRPFSVRPSGKWLVGPNSASSTISSFFIRLGNN